MFDTAKADGFATRAGWIRLLSLSDWDELRMLSSSLPEVPHRMLRAPETGLVMLRGRMGATGAPFNLGEATVTRCAVAAADREGHAYVMGRNAEHARTAALCDALLQSPGHSEQIREAVLVPLERKLRQKRMAAAGKAAATKVNFFTLVRGDD